MRRGDPRVHGDQVAVDDDTAVNRRRTSHQQQRMTNQRPQSIDIEDEFNYKIDRQRAQALRIEQAMAAAAAASKPAGRQGEPRSHSPILTGFPQKKYLYLYF